MERFKKQGIKYDQEGAAYIKKFYSQFPDHLVSATHLFDDHETTAEKLAEVWASNKFVVLVFEYKTSTNFSGRLHIHRAEMDIVQKRWVGDISWDELQEIKMQCGFGERKAVEFFPKQSELKDTNNVRHLFITKD